MNPLIFKEDCPLDLIAVGRLCVDLNANETQRPMEETRTFTKYVGISCQYCDRDGTSWLTNGIYR